MKVGGGLAERAVIWYVGNFLSVGDEEIALETSLSLINHTDDVHFADIVTPVTILCNKNRLKNYFKFPCRPVEIFAIAT